MRQSVIALDRARHRAIHDLAQKKHGSALKENEQQDYEKFITYLTFRIGKYCQQLIADHGEAAVEGLSCPAGNRIIFTGQADPAQTSREQITNLEELLSESLGQFDEELLKEEERIARRQPQQHESGYGSGSNGKGGGAGGSNEGATGGKDGSTGETGEQASGEQGMPGKEGGEGKTGKEVGGSTSGTGEGVGAAGDGSGTGSAEDQAQDESTQSGPRELETGYDDIVARQLREAAENETDPELKKKLWEEYYKYKEGS